MVRFHLRRPTPRRWKCTNPLLLSFRPLPLALTQKLSWFVVCGVCRCWCWNSFAPDRYLFLAHVYDIQPTPPCPTFTSIYFTLFFHHSLYIWLYLLPIRSNDYSKMLISVYYGISARTMGRLAGGRGHLAHSISSGLVSSVILWMLRGKTSAVPLSQLKITTQSCSLSVVNSIPLFHVFTHLLQHAISHGSCWKTHPGRFLIAITSWACSCSTWKSLGIWRSCWDCCIEPQAWPEKWEVSDLSTDSNVITDWMQSEDVAAPCSRSYCEEDHSHPWRRLHILHVYEMPTSASPPPDNQISHMRPPW